MASRPRVSCTSHSLHERTLDPRECRRVLSLEQSYEKRDRDVEPTGRCRVFLGSAAGVGETLALRDEGGRRPENRRDVVVRFVETHFRPSRTASPHTEMSGQFGPDKRVECLSLGTSCVQRSGPDEIA